MNTKDRNEKEKQATKVLYIAVGSMLVVMALIVTLSSVLSRTRKPTPSETTDTPNTLLTTPDTQTDRDPDIETDRTDVPVTLPTAADTDDKQADAPAPPAENVVPTLSSPVAAGVLSREHSGRELVYSSTMEDYRAHVGIDVNAALGECVYATAVGTVADVWYDAMMGRCVRVEHNGGLETIYKNLAEDLCEGIGIGSSLLPGDMIGYIGESAMIELAQEPHLHFEAKVNGKSIDPMSIMSDKAKGALSADNSYEG